MDAPAICRELESRGAALTVDGAILRVEPSRVLDDALRAEIRANKAQLMALAALAREVEAARWGAWCRPTAPLLAAWRHAEKICGHPLTILGTRREYSRRKNTGDENDEYEASNDQVGDRGIAGAARQR